MGKKPSISKKMVVAKDYNKRINAVYEQIASIIRKARTKVVHVVDSVMVSAYWYIGRYIVEEEQRGEARAGYGQELLQKLSHRLIKEFGGGFSVSTLTNIRKFYIAYQGRQKSYALRTKSDMLEFKPNLGWVHYRALMRENRLEVRSFYEIEASKNRWSGRELERQMGSLLFERLVK